MNRIEQRTLFALLSYVRVHQRLVYSLSEEGSPQTAAKLRRATAPRLRVVERVSLMPTLREVPGRHGNHGRPELAGAPD